MSWTGYASSRAAGQASSSDDTPSNRRTGHAFGPVAASG